MTSFTDDEDTLLRQWHYEGISAQEMANRLSRSRGSILGRWHRLGLMISAPRKTGPKRSTPFRKPKNPTQPHAGTPYVEPEIPRSDTNVTIMALTSRTCRFPIGDPSSPSFCYCGSTDGPLFPLQPYCRHHQKVAAATWSDHTTTHVNLTDFQLHGIRFKIESPLHELAQIAP